MAIVTIATIRLSPVLAQVPFEIFKDWGPAGVSVAAVIAVVVLFLRQQEKMSLAHNSTVSGIVKDFNVRMENRDKLISKMHDENLIAREKSRETVDKNTTAVLMNNLLTQELRDSNRVLSDAISKCPTR